MHQVCPSHLATLSGSLSLSISSRSLPASPSSSSSLHTRKGITRNNNNNNNTQHANNSFLGFPLFITTSNHSHQAKKDTVPAPGAPAAFVVPSINLARSTTSGPPQRCTSVTSIHPSVISGYKTQAEAFPTRPARDSSPSAGWNSSARPASRARCQAARCR